MLKALCHAGLYDNSKVFGGSFFPVRKRGGHKKSPQRFHYLYGGHLRDQDPAVYRICDPSGDHHNLGGFECSGSLLERVRLQFQERKIICFGGP